MSLDLSPRALRAIGELERLADSFGRDGGNYRMSADSFLAELRQGHDVLTFAEEFIAAMGGKL